MTVTVVIGDDSLDVDPARALTFGRGEGCTVRLTADDLGISRLAGSIEHDGTTWWLINRSATRPLYLVDELGIRSVLAPGRRLVIDHRLTVVVEGQVRRHALVVSGPEPTLPEPPAPEPASGLPTDMGFEVAYTADDKLALVALFAGYLEPFPRHDPHPRSYADAAARLGWARTTLVKRIEHLRERLTRSGVPNLLGDNALEHLAEHVLTSAVITRADLANLDTG